MHRHCQGAAACASEVEKGGEGRRDGVECRERLLESGDVGRKWEGVPMGAVLSKRRNRERRKNSGGERGAEGVPVV
jgi:hypothetical protein